MVGMGRIGPAGCSPFLCNLIRGRRVSLLVLGFFFCFWVCEREREDKAHTLV